MYSIDLPRDYSRVYNTVNNVLNAVHSIMTALIECWAFALVVAEVELVRLMLVLIVPFAVLLVKSIEVGALNRDAHKVQMVALSDNMMCLAYIDDKQLDKPLAYSMLIDMVANSTYHADVDRMYNMMLVNMSDNAFDAMVANNVLVTVMPMVLVVMVGLVLVMMVLKDNETDVMFGINHRLQKNKTTTIL